MNELQWTGKYKASSSSQSHGFIYIVNKSCMDQYFHLKIKLGKNFLFYNDIKSKEEGKLICQSHHDSICKAVEEEKNRYKAEFLDRHYGTPCEQIRHAQELEGAALIAQAWLGREPSRVSYFKFKMKLLPCPFAVPLKLIQRAVEENCQILGKNIGSLFVMIVEAVQKALFNGTQEHPIRLKVLLMKQLDWRWRRKRSYCWQN